MNRVLKKLIQENWTVFTFFLLLYGALFARKVLMDIPAQMYTLRQVCNGEVALPPTALFYGMSWLGALGCHESKIMLGIGAGIACASFLTIRWWLTRHVFHAYFSDEPVFGRISFLLALVGSLPTLDLLYRGWYVMGQPSPNYWMNGTLLASWPFALILFWQSYQQLLHPVKGWWKWMLLWLLLLLVSKPSYAFVFGLVYPLFLLGRHGWTSTIRWQLMPFIVLALLLVLEFYLIFLQPDSVYVKQFNHGQKSGVSICLFCVWSSFSSNIPLSILVSVLFPLGLTIAFWPEMRQKLLFWYAWAGFGAALAISAIFAQTGEEFSCWNFRWQTYIASYLLFMVSAMLAWEQFLQHHRQLTPRLKFLLGLFALHLLAGIGYLIKMFWSQSHY